MDMILESRSQAALSSVGASGYLTIDLGALRRNYKLLSEMVAPAQTAAVVKANAYGLGADQVAQALYSQGCRHFFVAQFVEAVHLRPNLPPEAQLFVLNGLQPGSEIRCAESRIIPVLNSLEQLQQWAGAARRLKRTLPAGLQVGTGMSRRGGAPQKRGGGSGALWGVRGGGSLVIMGQTGPPGGGWRGTKGGHAAEENRRADEGRGVAE
ncbi:alanine racemase, partial [Rhizobium sp. SEMIA 4085]|uniref:alanine racemase n=1 Tax=Rhizobium sp. SEMIA 4085 TaxID=2137761 RepID=UPI0014780CE4